MKSNLTADRAKIIPKTEAFNGQAFEEAARLQMQILKLEEGLAAARSSWDASRGKEPKDVHAEDIAQVVCRWTGISVARMVETEADKLARMEENLHKRIVGQEDAVRAVSDAIRRNRAGITSAPPGWARPSSPGRWPPSSWMTSRASCAWICPSTWSVTRSPR